MIVGGLAATAAFGRGGQTTGSRGALQTLLEQPFGRVLLGIVAFGLGCYAAWQFIRAVEDPENEGSSGKAIAKRIAFFVSGVIHVGLVIAAIRMVLGSGGGGGGGDSGAQGGTAQLMSYPLGQWLVAIVGLVIAGYGVQQLISAHKADLDSQLVLSGMDASMRQWVRRVCRFGMAARGVVFGIIGLFLLLAAWRNNPSEARGLGGGGGAQPIAMLFREIRLIQGHGAAGTRTTCVKRHVRENSRDLPGSSSFSREVGGGQWAWAGV